MDKETLSKYGWVVIVIIIIVILLGFAAPFGNFMADSTMSILESLSRTANLVPGTGNNQVIELVTNYSAAEVDANEHLYPIGKTDPYYVVATFNDNYTVMDVTVNGPDSDGLMKDFTTMDSGNNSELIDLYGNTVSTINIHTGIKNIGKGMMANLDTMSPIFMAPSSFHSNEEFFLYVMDLQNLLKYSEKINYEFQNVSLQSLNIYSKELQNIENSAFLGCINLNEINWGNSVLNIGDYAFYYCGLSNVKLPTTLKNIGMLSFCSSGIKSITLPEIETISPGAFMNCTYATGDLLLPSTCKMVSSLAFYNCCSLDGILSLNEGLETIGAGAFAMCYNMTNQTLAIPDSLTNLWGDGEYSGDMTMNLANNDIPPFANFAINTLKTFIVDNNPNFNVTNEGILKFGNKIKFKAAPVNSLLQLISETNKLPDGVEGSSGSNKYTLENGVIYKTHTPGYAPFTETKTLHYIPYNYTEDLIIGDCHIDNRSFEGLLFNNVNSITIEDNIEIDSKETLLSLLTYFAMFNDNPNDVVLNTTKITRDGDNFTIVS